MKTKVFFKISVMAFYRNKRKYQGATIIELFPWILAICIGTWSALCLKVYNGVPGVLAFSIGCILGLVFLITIIFGGRYFISWLEERKTGIKKSFTMKRSIIILQIQSKQKFDEWLKIIVRDHPSKIIPGVVYPAEIKRVRLVPSFGLFKSNKDLIAHVISNKPALLRSELRTVLKDLSHFEGKFDALQFDQFFDLEARDYLISRPEVREVVKDVAIHGGKVDAAHFDQFFK